MNELRTRDGKEPATRQADAVEPRLSSLHPNPHPPSPNPIVAEPADTSSLSHRDWIAAMVDRFERPLLAYAHRLLGGDHGRAQDAVQETFLRLCRENRDTIESRVAAWLFSVCRTRVIDMQRSSNHTTTCTDLLPIVDKQPDASQIAETAEQSSRLASLVNTLSPRQQEVLRLRLQAELSYREIAEITGLTVSNVGFHLHAAVRSLRDAMNAV
jgi:RNA polymerase sigma-70 factor, ECF subfamily